MEGPGISCWGLVWGGYTEAWREVGLATGTKKAKHRHEGASPVRTRSQTC
jgi:hypothetical protein